MKGIRIKKRDPISILLLFIVLCFNFVKINCIPECSVETPIFRKSLNKCVLTHCTEDEFSNGECTIANDVINKQWISKFLYSTENGFPIYNSIGQNDDGDTFFESSLGNPNGLKKIFALNDKGRGYIEGIPELVVDSDSSLYSTYGDGVIVKINEHKCYLKLSYNESIEFYDFDDKKYTSAKFEDIFGHKIESHHNSLLRTSTANTFIFAYITTGNYLIMQKFKVVSNDASNCIQIIKTFKEEVKTIPKNSRRCMITKKQYVECLDLDLNQMYVVRVYDSNLNFLKQFELEKNNAPSEKAYDLYHEVVWLKGEISIFIYFVDTAENKAKPIMVLKELAVTTRATTLNNLNSYLKRDVVYGALDYSFSDTDNSLAIFNEYYYGLASLAKDRNHLVISLFNIFNDDKTIDTHYFEIALADLYNIHYQSGLKAFGFKNGYGVQFNYDQDNENRSGFIILVMVIQQILNL